MTKRTRRLALLLAASLSCQPASDDAPHHETAQTLPVALAPGRSPREKLSPQLRRIVYGRSSDTKLRVLVDLSVQLDLHKLGEALREQQAGKRERRRIAVDALRQVAEQSQRRLEPFLEEGRRGGSIDSYRSFTVVNRLLVSASPAAIRALAERDEVAAIEEESTGEALVLTSTSRASHSQDEQSWALRAIGAQAVWRRGWDGRGVVVGIIDAGASASHEQLRGNFRGGTGSWYDPTGVDATPQDALTGHGTTILSVAVGQNLDGLILGTAPQAEWIACAGIPDGRYNNIAFTECADWMLNEGQPDVLINAWLLPDEGCLRPLQRIVDAWRAAEILPIFAAGNEGPEAGTDRSPANYVGLYPGDGTALSVGGVVESGRALANSGRGPNSCDGSTYPSLVAPAEDVLAAFPLTPTAYKWAKGTSVAAGFVAGAAAVLLQAYPEAAVSEVEAALRSGAIDLGPAGPDNAYGHGQLYLPAALDSLGRFLRNERSNKDSGTASGR
ncbi:MAG: S8 family serine peptidase [Gemmatimonadales bacterium]|nr:S8 family serine peptidase [Gemmatimonadales bacterium]NIN48507.1 S8 family serine peptidase [Gemmatimonadales bacterium]NIP05971.1 S8 family serine peptidase [Gemmatimonadales bacterium]NIQ99923.1 S8 family serine peptidase [Gemmatimonadales bacterium]NIS64382.1 S8 family serine peptidase [Gemmatimonadales bacterium]